MLVLETPVSVVDDRFCSVVAAGHHSHPMPEALAIDIPDFNTIPAIGAASLSPVALVVLEVQKSWPRRAGHFLDSCLDVTQCGGKHLAVVFEQEPVERHDWWTSSNS
jgi:hypothetical protein